MKILVTGFDPFGQDTINPAIEAVKLLPPEIEGAKIVPLEIPTVFKKSAEIMRDAILEEQPNYVLHVGQAGGRAEMTPERVAINLDDARIPDNAGQQPIDQLIQETGENAYFSQLPIKAMVEFIRRENIPASVSNTAGTFVCNHIMYQTLYMTTHEFSSVKAGFMHIPFIPEQVENRPKSTPSLPLEEIVKGIEASIKAIIAYDGKPDIKSIGGKTH